MTKFDRVLKFVSTRKVFTRSQFESRFGEYSNTYSTYLTLLVNAGVVANPFAGAFTRIVPKAQIRGLTPTQAKELARALSV